jgi:hypothetical protein
MSLKLDVTYAECHIYALYAECRYAECRYSECHYFLNHVSTLIENNGPLCLSQVLDLSGSG